MAKRKKKASKRRSKKTSRKTTRKTTRKTRRKQSLKQLVQARKRQLAALTKTQKKIDMFDSGQYAPTQRMIHGPIREFTNTVTAGLKRYGKKKKKA